MKTPTTWPKVIKSGSATVKIYRLQNKKDDRSYEEFKVAYYDRPGHRVIKTFSKYENAYTHAASALAIFTRGDVQALALTSEDRLVYLRAQKALAGVAALDFAAVEYAAAKKKLGSHSLQDAVDFYLSSCADLVPRTVREVVDELIQSRRTPPNRSRPASRYYIQDLESRLGKFADSFQCPLLDVGTAEVRLFMDSIKGTGRTWYNYARLLKTLFRYAQGNRYYPKNVDPFEGLDVDYQDDGEIEIFTPAELRRVLAVAKSDLLPFLVIGAFAGLRHAEVCRMDWADVKGEHIEVRKGNAKTRSRRLVPIVPNLAAWLTIFKKPSGPVVPYANVGNQLVKLIASCKREEKDGVHAGKHKALHWKHNGLRHSFVSYRLSIVQNENQVAMEAGNSPAMLHQHYRELVTSDQAKEWFSIAPQPENKIVPFKFDSATTGSFQGDFVSAP